jgi:hypothetical protein
MEGWGVRPYNWEFSAGVQQEVAPRVSVSVGYFRRINGNFQITDNEALAASDFTQYAVTAPTDPRLPTSGQTVTGFFDQNINPPARNVVKDADNFGKQQLHWNGVDVNVDARLRNGLLLQGGVSTGKTEFDNCEIAAQVPEVLNGLTGVTATGGLQPISFCHQETGFVPQYKGLASYTLPWYGIRVSGTYQSLPGPALLAQNIYNNNNRTTSTTLARPFTLAQANANLVAPGTEFGDRLNQFDLRLTKIVNVGKGRLDLNVDFFNAFNSDAVITENSAFGPAFRRPTTVIQPRFVKFGARWDF